MARQPSIVQRRHARTRLCVTTPRAACSSLRLSTAPASRGRRVAGWHGGMCDACICKGHAAQKAHCLHRSTATPEFRAPRNLKAPPFCRFSHLKCSLQPVMRSSVVHVSTCHATARRRQGELRELWKRVRASATHRREVCVARYALRCRFDVIKACSVCAGGGRRRRRGRRGCRRSSSSGHACECCCCCCSGARGVCDEAGYQLACESSWQLRAYARLHLLSWASWRLRLPQRSFSVARTSDQGVSIRQLWAG